MKRVYILTIQYHEDSDQIDFIQEEIIEDTPSIEYGDISLDEYFDEEGLALIENGYIVGES